MKLMFTFLIAILVNSCFSQSLNSFTNESNFFENKNKTNISMNDSIKPMITFTYHIRRYANASGGMSAASALVIDGYRLDGGDRNKLGFMRKNIKKQLSIDPISMKYFNSHLVNYKISFFTSFISCGVFLTGMYYFTKQDINPSAKTLSKTLCFSGMGMLAVSYVFNKISENKLRKSIKTYNKNNGYGYLDGLEFNDSKRKRIKDQKQN